jgi:soluble lytic murein transglycosylase-like protein
MGLAFAANPVATLEGPTPTQVWPDTVPPVALTPVDSTATLDTSTSEVAALTAALVRTGAPVVEARRWAGWFVQYGHQAGVRPTLLAAIALHESDWKVRAYNHGGGGSHGLMQILPERWLTRFSGDCAARPTRANLRQPRVNICYGAHIFAYWASTAHGNERKALRGYNSGFRYLRNGYDRRVFHALTRLTLTTRDSTHS